MVGRNSSEPDWRATKSSGQVSPLNRRSARQPSIIEGVRVFICLLAALFATGCARKAVEAEIKDSFNDRQDHHSYARPHEVQVTHVDLDLDVHFDRKILEGTALLSIDRKITGAPLQLDTRDLKIKSVEVSVDHVTFTPAEHKLGSSDPILGAPLTVTLPLRTKHVKIAYETSPQATGLQWLNPSQTAGKKQPFLYSQSQAIHARSWIPIQDSPAVRMTYSGKIRTPKASRAVMSAGFDVYAERTGEYSFVMRQSIPAYLIAIAVGDLDFRAISKRTGVWAEPSVVEQAAKEFEDLEKMMQAAESLYGPYIWDRYDVLILPPSFPFGGMENPRLTFATPTLLAGDKSLVSVIAHELAHSWSGNLVTNATWRDFWLNEGFTTYIERRIQEEVYGRARAEMEALIETRELESEFERLPDADEILYVDLKGRDPDDGMTQVPYVKGMLFLRRLEELFGRTRFDGFLRSYFAQNSLKSITTQDFVRTLRESLFTADPEAAKQVDLSAWIGKPGLPADAPKPKSEAFDAVDKIAAGWKNKSMRTDAIPLARWTTQETMRFLTNVRGVDADRLAELDARFQFTASKNAEIAFEWFRVAIAADYSRAYPALERFLTEVGRRKFLRPLYEDLVKTPEGRKRAQAIYAKARPGYHSIAASTIDGIVK